MTSIRAKRNSKAPNRFSSDNSQIETSNANGETIIDYNDNSTSTTHNLVPINRTIKFKPALREPLKVKLPKLKRPNLQSSKEQSFKSSVAEIKIHKIKLPTLSGRKSKESSEKSDSKKSTKYPSSEVKTEPKASPAKNTDSQLVVTNVASKKPTIARKQAEIDNHANLNDSFQYKKDVSQHLNHSVSSKSTNEDVSASSMINASLSSEDADDGATSKMEIVVSQPDVTNGSEIHCPCGVDDDLGVMVECESCSTWQHGHCINVGTEDDAYEGYICAFCTLPQGKARDSLRQLTVGDKFQSKFKALKALKEQNDPHLSKDSKLTTENNHYLTAGDLLVATKDLFRVLNSLKVKWRLLTSQSYELELRIWQNPNWSKEDPNGSEKDKNFYFMDRCKSNLKLNIRNIVKKMEMRSQLIDYSLSLIMIDEKNDESSKQELKKVRELLETIVQGVKEIKNKLKNAYV